MRQKEQKDALLGKLVGHLIFPDLSVSSLFTAHCEGDVLKHGQAEHYARQKPGRFERYE